MKLGVRILLVMFIFFMFDGMEIEEGGIDLVKMLVMWLLVIKIELLWMILREFVVWLKVMIVFLENRIDEIEVFLVEIRSFERRILR